MNGMMLATVTISVITKIKTDVLYGLIIIAVTIFVILLVSALVSPFHFPYFDHYFDVSGKKKPDLDTLIEQYINDGGYPMIQIHQSKINKWKKECEETIQKSRFLKKLRQKQYERCLDEAGAYCFYMTRNQTRYQQRHYVKESYQVSQTVAQAQYSFEWLSQKYKQLEEIGFESTLRDYHSREQRKLMTRKLREQIMQRDRYTCQVCGKYMPDEVGLQVDHIIPVAKGGKTVASNLQVLCSKCNGRKKDKV